MNKYLIALLTYATYALGSEQEICLLNDKSEIQEYILNFPIHTYKVHNVPGQGKFYIDNIDDMIKNILKRGAIWEKHIISLLDTYIRVGSTVIDIGAHIGTHTITMAHKVGPNGAVWAFEPQKKIYRELVNNCVLNDVQNRVNALRFALGDKHSLVKMQVSVTSNEGGTPLSAEFERSNGDLVEMRTLDSFNLRNVSVIKLDAEGAEDLILDGAKETILLNQPVIIIEIQGGWTYKTAPQHIRDKINQTKAKLVALGYHVIHLRDHDYLAIPR